MANGIPLALLAAFSLASVIARAATAPGDPAAPAPSSPPDKGADFKAKAEQRRQDEIRKLEPLVAVPAPNAPSPFTGYPWKTGIVTTIFWIGSGQDGERGQKASAWDHNWVRNFGGFDDPLPAHRTGFIPAKFIPRQNPFYIALPYNDIADDKLKPEAEKVIPWFKEASVKDGQSICQNRWIEIRNAAGKACYAQWSDCGPFRTDQWQYVFGPEKPTPNTNQGAGLNVSPAVRDFLGLAPTDVTDWKFVDFRKVPRGPWSLYGENNPFVQQERTHGILLSEKPATSLVPPDLLEDATAKQ
jgi:hypothetical protein